jgi:hypothetical protein
LTIDLLRRLLQLRAEMMRLKAERDDIAASLAAESDARIEQQRQHEALIAEWRQALEVREKDMEDLQERLNPPRDLELLRVQVRLVRPPAPAKLVLFSI